MSQSEIHVPSDRAEQLEAAFLARSRLVDRHDGFIGLELLRDVHRPGRFVLMTRWRDRAAFSAYMRSRDFKTALQRQHDGIEEQVGGAPLRQLETVELGD